MNHSRVGSCPCTLRIIGLDLVWSKYSCGFAVVVLEQPTKPLPTLDRSFRLPHMTRHRHEQHIALALMIPLLMIMCIVLGESLPYGAFPKQNEPRETFLLHRFHPALRVGIQVRAPRGQHHPLYSRLVNGPLKSGAVLGITIMDQ